MRRPADAYAELRSDLQHLEKRSRRHLRARAVTAAVPAALEAGMPLLLIAPAALFLFRLVLLVAAPREISVSPAIVAMAMLLPYGLFVAGQIGAAWLSPIGRREALAALDGDADRADRLMRAESHLAHRRLTPEQESDVADAARYAREARWRRFEIRPAEGSMSSWAWLYPLAGAALVALALAIGPSSRNAGREGREDAAAAPVPIDRRLPERRAR